MPISTRPVRDLPVMVDQQFRDIKELLAPRSRRRLEARTKLRPLAIVEASLRGTRTQPTERELGGLIRKIQAGAKWQDLAGRVGVRRRRLPRRRGLLPLVGRPPPPRPSAPRLLDQALGRLLRGAPRRPGADRPPRPGGLTSSLALDVYCWLTYRLATLSRPLVLSWLELAIQFGSQTARPRAIFHEGLVARARMSCRAGGVEVVGVVGVSGRALIPCRTATRSARRRRRGCGVRVGQTDGEPFAE